MIKLYDFPCISKREAEAEECKTMIELNATLNSMKSFVSEEEKKEKKKEWNDKKYQNNKTEIIEKVRNYRQNNKTKISEKKKKYYNDNKTEILEKAKEYRNKTEIQDYKKKCYEDNKTQILEKRKVKIKCEFCGFESQKCSLKRHQKSLKCMKFQEFVDVE